MAYYSLVASLPALQIGDEPPFSTEEYIENCAQWVSERETETLRRVLLAAPGVAPCHLANEWNNIETQLRNALARNRAQKLGIDPGDYLRPHEGFSGTIEVLATDAFTHDDPIDLEQAIDRARWQLADSELVGQDAFGFGKVLAYGIQLKIVERWHRMDPGVGKQKIEAVIEANTEKEEQTEAEG